ncbi:MAG: 30S ribosomal protein S27e [Candidatus Woesearchaeota archaeon]|jgi:small subunit ribosomal protein S27e|nr:30S ribosomal protein S27e [Candidatus Woesearchaeota archaeon]
MVEKNIETNKEKSGFVKVKCHSCGNEQVIFGKAATEIKCLNKECAEVLAIPRGGKAAIKAEILELY